MTRAERIEAAARALMTAYWQKGEHAETADAAQALAKALNSTAEPEPGPAPAGWVDVEADALITEYGSGVHIRMQAAIIELDGSERDAPRSHTVRVKVRLPLPAAPVVVEGAIVERAEREEG